MDGALEDVEFWASGLELSQGSDITWVIQLIWEPVCHIASEGLERNLRIAIRGGDWIVGNSVLISVGWMHIVDATDLGGFPFNVTELLVRQSVSCLGVGA